MRSSDDDSTAAPAFDLYSDSIDADPFPYYRRLRDAYPCYWSARNGIWIISRYHDVLRAAQDWRTFSSSAGNLIDELPGRPGATLGTTDPPRHDRLRALCQSAFAKRNVQELAEPTRRIANIAIREIQEKRRFDFVLDFASRITVGVLFEMLGLPHREPAEIRRKVVLSISTDKSRRGRNDEQVAAFRELADFISEEVAARQGADHGDLIGALANAEIDHESLTDREVILTSTTLVMAGVESLSSFMSMLALNLCTFPDERRKVTANMSLLGPAIEESLRFNTSAQRFKRTATREVELHGQLIRAGDPVALAYGAANRDERKFPDPDTYNVERGSIDHLGFGSGTHFCLGNSLARVVTRAAMELFLTAIPDFNLVSSSIEWVPSSNFRSPMSLPFEC